MAASKVAELAETEALLGVVTTSSGMGWRCVAVANEAGDVR